MLFYSRVAAAVFFVMAAVPAVSGRIAAATFNETGLASQSQHAGAPAGSRRTGDIIKETLPATVLIEGKTQDGKEALGTGFVIDPAGVIVTNLHVVRGMFTARVRLANGDTYDRVSVRAFDERKDIALLQVPAFGLPVVRLGDSERVQQGDAVILIGNPLGLQGTVSTGIISAVRPVDGYRVFQTDAAASPGNSGGPMLNEAGEVVGILTFGFKSGENLNFVVPVNYARGLASINESMTLDQLARRLPPEPAVTAQPTAPAATTSTGSKASPTAVSTLGPDATGGEKSHALVYVYREAGWFGRALEPRVTLTLDDVELVTMDNKRYFSVWVSPGHHSMDVGGGATQSCQQPLSGDFQAGMVYFLRIDLFSTTCFFVKSINPDVARLAVMKLKPLNTSNVRHSAVRLQ